MREHHRVAVVTGAASGIGRQIALQLASDGFALVIHTAKNVRGLQEVASEIQDLGAPVRAITADYLRPHLLSTFVDAAYAWRGHIHAWVNNAGADVLTGAARNRSFEQRLQELWQVDVAGTMSVSRLVAERMKAWVGGKHGQSTPVIINTGWDQAPFGMEGESGQLFCTVKAAVMAFSKALAQSVGPDVRVNCIAPGWIKTAWGQGTSEYWDRRARDESLLARWGTPEDIALAVSWLAGPTAEFINGQTIEINGGWKRTR
ncbi:MAG: SDR family oxidoreductase [Pirellulales bacterium]